MQGEEIYYGQTEGEDDLRQAGLRYNVPDVHFSIGSRAKDMVLQTKAMNRSRQKGKKIYVKPGKTCVRMKRHILPVDRRPLGSQTVCNVKVTGFLS